MAAGNYVNVQLKKSSLAEIYEAYQQQQYPLVARSVSNNYEIPNTVELPGLVEVLLEEPKEVSFITIRVCQYFDREEKIKEKGLDYVEERNKYVGKEYLLPAQYSGDVKLINKPGRHRRFVSVTQVIEELPRLIQCLQTINCMTTKGRSATITKGTILEVKSVETPLLNERHVVCEADDVLYELPESTPINCVAVDDEQWYKLHDVASSMLLPKSVQFVDTLSESVLLQDDDKAHLLSILVSGPFKILNLRRRRVFVVWLKEEQFTQRVGVILEERWKNQILEVRHFGDKQKKKEYVQSHFGVQINSSFVENGFYNMRPLETYVVFLLVPKKSILAAPHYENVDTENTKKESAAIAYENVGTESIRKEPAALDYDDVSTENTGEKPAVLDFDDVGTENTKEDDPENIYETPSPAISRGNTIPVLQAQVPLQQIFKKEEVVLPLMNKHKISILDTLKEKARLGFDKVHEQLLRKVKAKEAKAEKFKLKSKVAARLPNDLTKQPVESKDKEQSQSSGIYEGKKNTRSDTTERLFRDNFCRPPLKIPITQQKPLTKCEERNRTDDDKIYMFEQSDAERNQCEPIDEVKVKEKEHEQDSQSLKVQIYCSKTDTLKIHPDYDYAGCQDQTKEDFYEYTREELAECLNRCGLYKMATLCYEEDLDGAFFKNFDLQTLQNEPFFLNKIEAYKIKLIIEDGWRPLDQ